MSEKFNKNAKVEQLTKVVFSHGEEKGLVAKDPLLHSFLLLLQLGILSVDIAVSPGFANNLLYTDAFTSMAIL